LIKSPEFKKEKHYILGQGWNTFFTKDFVGLVVKISLKGIKIDKETDRETILNVAAGEDWIELVKYAVKNNWGGMENLSLIPGTVGAAPHSKYRRLWTKL